MAAIPNPERIPKTVPDDGTFQREGHDPTTGRFLPGHSGNPSGRPVGSIDRRRRAIIEGLDDVIAVIKAAALEDRDMTAASLLLSRALPPLRSESRTVEFEFDPDASVAEQSKQILVAVSKGQVDPDTAKLLLDMLSAYVGLKDVEMFLAELKKLRGDLPAGGVQTYDVRKA